MVTLTAFSGISRRKEQGFSLVMTIVMLSVILLSSLGLLYAMRGGISTAGNIAFRQAATRVADVAGQTAYLWVQSTLSGNSSALDNTSAATLPGYYAIYNEADPGCSNTAAFLPQTYNFAGTNSSGRPCAMAFGGSTPIPVNQYTLYYVVHRMSGAYGPCPGAGCTGPLQAASNNPGCSHDTDSPNYCGLSSSLVHVYYRITVKVVGPMHNSRYVQSFFY
ncbi:MAG: type II secretion system protein [Proteobacteria bacterium]|nr:type II secretion system protein [Pseudomonadota bacterium]HQR03443.1 hypothetical protein [Rhodocyclaceae bacterium]